MPTSRPLRAEKVFFIDRRMRLGVQQGRWVFAVVAIGAAYAEPSARIIMIAGKK
jgi:hypothetical protein